MGKTFKDSIYKDKKVHQKRKSTRGKAQWKSDVNIDEWDSTRIVLKSHGCKNIQELVKAKVKESEQVIDHMYLLKKLEKAKTQVGRNLYHVLGKAIDTNDKYVNSIFCDILHLIEFTDTEFEDVKKRLVHRRYYKTEQFKLNLKLLGKFSKIEKNGIYNIKSKDVAKACGQWIIMSE